MKGSESRHPRGLRKRSTIVSRLTLPIGSPDSSITAIAGTPCSRIRASASRIDAEARTPRVQTRTQDPPARAPRSPARARVASERARRPRSRRRSRRPDMRAPARAYRAGRSVPSRITTIQSASRTASSISCVTNRTVLRSVRWMRRNSDCSRSRVSGSTAPNGSSISSTGGSAASARATPTRCASPPESSAGYLHA